ncbi:MAG TPA: BamA/TamA family outer membrane protein [Bacteroidota bacterium]|nr:BamA/TamA family outer membrane protein [Bacteroidota bacterium]
MKGTAGIASVKSLLTTLILLAAAVLSGVSAAYSQSTTFGKNKIQYHNFDWYYIQTTHFDLYFDRGNEGLASFAADAAESAYTSISRDFRYRITQRIPFVVYNSHNTFQQTNVISSFLDEGIGGVTELFKNRVVVPFEGDYRKFRHVIHHELVHAVINDMFYGGSIQSIIANNITLRLPLWFNEGLAEYEALGWDANSDMFMRDATIHGYLPPIRRLDGYFAYRGGQSVWNYIAGKYGSDEIGEILNRIRGAHNVDQGFRGAIGMDVEELSEKWEKEQKVVYWPDIATRTDPANFAVRFTDHKKENSFYNTSPAISPDGNRLAFISDRSEYFDVYLMNTIDGAVTRKLISGQQTADFEELHLLTPGMSWSPDSKRLALAVKSGNSDAIILVDVESGDQQKLELGLNGIFSVDWSPSRGSDRLAFIGIRDGRSDVYVCDLGTDSVVNLTDDIFSDSDPSWSADGKSVYFASDRRGYLDGASLPAGFRMQNFDYSQTDLYSVDPATGKIDRLTDLASSSESSPVATPDGGHLLFISDRNGINNIYLRDLATGAERPLTNSISGVYQLSLSRNGEKLAFSSLNNAGFDIFMMRMPLQVDIGLDSLEMTELFRQKTGGRRMPAGVNPDTVAVGEGVVLRTTTESTIKSETEPALNLKNYVFRRDSEDGTPAGPDSAAFPSVTDNIDKGGNYRINKYRLNFSPDIIYGNAGYNTFYGVQGSTIMAFSDMLGDHQIYLITNLLFDLKNSDYALAYLYLPKRIDYGIQAFHSARAVYLRDASTGLETLNRFRNYGVNFFGLYPMTKFQRLDFGLSWLNVRRDNLDVPSAPSDKSTVILPTLGYVEDTSLWGLIAPSTGRRFNITAMASPGVSSDAPSFYSITGDYRKYLRLGPYYSLVLRLAGGGSFGRNPQRFILGGVDNWINNRFENNSFPITTADDYLFLTTGIPLRGYNYNARNGTKYALFNMELRFPLLGYVVAGPLPVFFQTLTGTLFLDAGATWTRGRDVRLFTSSADGGVVTRDLLPGMGYGIRMVILGFLLKMDVGWAWNLRQFSTPQYYFSLGADI